MFCPPGEYNVVIRGALPLANEKPPPFREGRGHVLWVPKIPGDTQELHHSFPRRLMAWKRKRAGLLAPGSSIAPPSPLNTRHKPESRSLVLDLTHGRASGASGSGSSGRLTGHSGGTAWVLRRSPQKGLRRLPSSLFSLCGPLKASEAPGNLLDRELQRAPTCRLAIQLLVYMSNIRRTAHKVLALSGAGAEFLFCRVQRLSLAFRAHGSEGISKRRPDSVARTQFKPQARAGGLRANRYFETAAEALTPRAGGNTATLADPRRAEQRAGAVAPGAASPGRRAQDVEFGQEGFQEARRFRNLQGQVRRS